MICDEITSALDVTVQAHLVALLNRLRAERQIAFLFISHDLGFIAEVADEVMVLERGEVRAQGSAGAILGQPADPYTRGLVAAYAGAPRPRSEPALAGE